MLEVCVDNLESVSNALLGEADELEICSSLLEGGLTPSPGLVLETLKMVNDPQNRTSNRKPKINIMIRCRGGTNFCFNEYEMKTMLGDIKVFKTKPIDRFVFGALTDNGEIDLVNCSKVIYAAFPVPVTFHRAFDLCIEPRDSLQKIIDLGFSRVLTSGQRSSVDEDEAKLLIKDLLMLHGKDIDVMPGAGVNCNNADFYAKLGCKIIHSSCKVVRKIPSSRTDLCMGSSEIFVCDENIVRNLKQILNS